MASWLGAGYLLYLGVVFIRQAGRQTTGVLQEAGEEQGVVSFRRSFVLGFLTNATNPKATLFFLAVFTTIVSAQTPLAVQMLYGVWMCVINALWFVLVSLLFTSPPVRERFLRLGHWFERVMGVLLIAFSVRLLWGLVGA